jgi:hypothetical protein
VVLLDWAGALVLDRQDEVDIVWRQRAHTFFGQPSTPQGLSKNAKQSTKLGQAVLARRAPPAARGSASAHIRSDSSSTPPLSVYASKLANSGVNACVTEGRIAGGIGTQYRRVAYRESAAASCSPSEWTRFDRGAVVIQVLNLAMKEDITRRWDFISDAVGTKKGASDKKPESLLWDWLGDLPSQGSHAAATIRPQDVSRHAQEQSMQDRRMHVERMKSLAINNMESGLCGGWDRRIQLDPNGCPQWEQRTQPSQSSTTVSWDRNPSTARALTMLLKGIPTCPVPETPCQASASVLSRAADMLQTAPNE